MSALRQLTDPLVQVPDPAGQRVLDLLHAGSAEDPGDEAGFRVQRGLPDELLDGRVRGDQLLRRFIVETGQPPEGLVQVLPGPPPALHPCAIVRMDRGEGPV